ncbi:MAG TPA: zinc ribbon domain-containing protein [Gemmatimonadales bacterium]|nr:zinc ribbon domain-containing protein [Gemmatimonadales bacterium]
MSDLHRLFSLIVTNIAATDASRLHSPMTIGDLMQRVAPYRSSRRHLDVVTSEEYELLILRLAAGEEGLARLEPPETLARFRKELAGLHPDLHILTFDEAATLTLSRDAVAHVLGGHAERGYAPPAERGTPADAAPPDHAAPAEPPAPIEEVEILEWEAPGEVHTDRCGFCGGTLPVGRAVNFCPHCGQSLRALHCPQCNEEIELGWRHCVACGAALAEPS